MRNSIQMPTIIFMSTSGAKRIPTFLYPLYHQTSTTTKKKKHSSHALTTKLQLSNPVTCKKLDENLMTSDARKQSPTICPHHFQSLIAYFSINTMTIYHQRKKLSNFFQLPETNIMSKFLNYTIIAISKMYGNFCPKRE